MTPETIGGIVGALVLVAAWAYGIEWLDDAVKRWRS